MLYFVYFADLNSSFVNKFFGLLIKSFILGVDTVLLVFMFRAYVIFIDFAGLDSCFCNEFFGLLLKSLILGVILSFSFSCFEQYTD